MKTKKAIIYIALLFILLIPITTYASPFKLNWENTKKDIVTKVGESENFLLTDNNYGYKDGYITSRLSINETEEKLMSTLTYYDAKGNVLKEKTFDNYIFLSFKEYEDSLYASVIELNMEELPDDVGNVFDLLDSTTAGSQPAILDELTVRLVKINEELNTEVNVKVTMEDEIELYYFVGLQLGLKLIGYESINIVNNKVIFLGEDLKIANLDLSNVRTEEMNETKLKNYFPILRLHYDYMMDFKDRYENAFDDIQTVEEYITFITNNSPYDYPISFDMNENNIVKTDTILTVSKTKPSGKFALMIKTPSTTVHNTIRNSNEDNLGIFEPLKGIVENNLKNTDKAASAAPETYTVPEMYVGVVGKLQLLDKNEKVIWEKASSDYVAFFNTKIIGNYIVTIGLKADIKEDILFLENEEDGIKKICTDVVVYDFDGNVIQTISNNSAFLSLYKTKTGFITSNVSFTLFSEDNLRMNSKIYSLANNIETKIEGKGSIKVDDSSLPGDEVIFEIIPGKGYVVDKVKVTDKNGNTIIFTSNKFTMPDKDVIIEATFVVANPNTKDISMVIAFTIILTSIFLIAKNYKKIKWLN